MNLRWLLPFLAAFSGIALSNSPTIEVIEQFDDFKVVAFINESDMANYPLWRILTDAPPLLVTEVIQSIQFQYKKTNRTLRVDSIKEINLREIPRHGNYWHYLVKIKTDDSVKQGYEIYIVLMNGKIIRAFIEPDA